MALFRIVSLSCVMSLRGLTVHRENDDPVQTCVEQYADGLDLVRKDLGGSVRELSRLRPSRISMQEMVFNVGPGTTATHYVTELLDDAGLRGFHYTKRWAPFNELMEIVGRCYPDSWDNCSHSHERHEQHGSPPQYVRDACYKHLREFDFSDFGKAEHVSDTPFPELFVHLYRAYPNAKFILSTRDAEEWAHKRAVDHNDTLATIQEPCGRFVYQFTEQQNQELFRLHNQLVHCVVPESRLLELDIFTHPEEMEGMPQRLGSFLHGHP